MKLLSSAMSWIVSHSQAIFAWCGLLSFGIGASLIYLPAGLIAGGLLLFIDSVGWFDRSATP